MKKLKLLVITVFMVGFVLIKSLTPTYANPADLYDDETENPNGGTTIELLENSIYEINFVAISGAPNNGNFAQYIDRDDFEINLETSSGSLNENFRGDSTFWENVFQNVSLTIETLDNPDTLTIELFSITGSESYAMFAQNYDIQVIWIGNTGPVDNVAPEYTYSHVAVETPYYDLVTVNEILNELEAIDDEDGDVTDRIQVYEDHYSSIFPKVVDDEYFIVFMVDDTAGNAAYLRVDIYVIDDLKPTVKFNDVIYEDGHIFNMTWYNDEFSQENVDISFNQFYMTAEIVDDYYGTHLFFDLIDDEFSAWFFEQPIENWSAFEPYVAGVYNLPLIIVDPSGNTITVYFNITVLENHPPVINGPDTIYYEVTDFRLEDLFNDYNATDQEDGTLSLELLTSWFVDDPDHSQYLSTISFDYSWADNPTLGNYHAVLSAIDSFGRITEKLISIRLVDTTNPVIKVDGINTSSYSHTVYMSDTSTLQSLINTITVTDSYEGNLTSELVIPAFPSFTVPGTHNLSITVQDSSGNTATLNLQVIVADDIPPVINGATKIVKGLTETLTLTNILNTLTVTDNVDNNIELELVSDSYTGNNLNVGSYLVKYKAVDSAGNTTFHNVRVWVVDNKAPAWIINDYFVNLGVNESINRIELVQLLQAAGMIGSDISYTVSFLTDEYSGNEDIEGSYNVVMKITYANGSEDQIAVKLVVPEPLSEDVIVIEPDPSLTGLQKFWHTIKNIVITVWNAIKSVIDFIWNGIIVPVYEFIFVKDTNVIPVNDNSNNTNNNQTTEPPVLTLPEEPSIPVNEI